MAVLSIKCPNCGGELVFDPSTQEYVCPYCRSTYTQAKLDEMLAQKKQDEGNGEEQAQEAKEFETDSQSGQGVVYSCPSCGAEIVTDETTAATFCYFCHNPVVLEGRVSGEFLPDRVIPFKISREKAVDAFLSYVRKKKYVPKDFFNEQQIEKMTGVYYPYWLYDTNVDGNLVANGTRIRTWRSGDTEFTETSIFDVRRQGAIEVDNLTRNALKKTSGELVEKVQPYDMKDLKAFSMGYLTGFMAEKRDIGKNEFSGEFREEAGKYARQLLEGSASGYATLKVTEGRYVPTRETYTYALLPVWVLTYRSLAGKFYYYAMNGQTGTVAGELPIDRKKLLFHSVILGLVVMLCAIAIAYFLI